LQIHPFLFVFSVKQITKMAKLIQHIHYLGRRWNAVDMVIVHFIMFLSFSIVGCIRSYQVWDKVHDYFHKQTRAILQQLRPEICSMSLDDCSMDEFLKLKALVDRVAFVGDLVFSSRTHWCYSWRTALRLWICHFCYWK